MRRTRTIVFVAFIGVLMAGIGVRAPAASSLLCPVATPERAKALAERAARYLAQNGAQKSFTAFMRRDGGFIDGDLYVFVFDGGGVLRASGGWPETVGSRVTLSQDGSGIVWRMFQLARTKGRGWVHYSWYNPCSRQLEPKMSYIIKVKGFIVGVGAYKKVGV